MKTEDRRPQKRGADREESLHVTTVAFPDATYMALRRLAVERRTTLRALVLEACDAYLARTNPRRR